jgi:phosphoribosylanthranilate isomerase
MMWLKICGMTSPEAVAAALEAQVDAIGFVFAPSVRRLAPAAAAALAAPARGRLLCVAVTQHPAQELLDEILSQFRPDVLQSDLEDLSSLRLPRSLALLPVLRAGQVPPAQLPARLLYEGTASGTGVACDWTGASAIARLTQLVLAGGLTERTVAEAIAQVRPFGVDVSSGVEGKPGSKSPQKILDFAAAARAGFRSLSKARVLDEEHSP